MFDQLFGDMQKKQEDMKNKLASITLDHTIDDAITISLNANKEVLNISIHEDKIDLTDKEQLEDLLVVGLNEALQKAEEVQVKESQSLLGDIMPGGLDNLFGK
jgi:DNA-binding protein YbaB